MNRLSFLILTLMVVVASQAQTALIVHQKSGGTVEFAFREKPVVTYNNGFLIISVAEASVTYPLIDVQKFTFDKVGDNYTRITVPAEVMPQPTYIYNSSGILMRTLQPSEDGSTPATLNGLPTGTYIIKNGKITYKTIKR